MLNELVGQFLKTTDGSGLLQELQAKGMTEQQATQGITATAESAMSQPAADGASPGGALGGLGALAGMLGGGGGGGMAGMLGGMLGGTPAPEAPGAPGPGGVSMIAQIVAQKTGLAPAMAEMLVAAVLPKLAAMLSGAPAEGAAPGENPSGAAGVLGSLFR